MTYELKDYLNAINHEKKNLMDTDDEMIAAKRAIEWVKNTELENIKTKALYK